ncbi:MAG: hypothetical protein AB7K52_11940 [Phycisphaerales bacterium]
MSSVQPELVSVLAWPSAWSRQRIAEVLVESLGIDPADARLLAASPAPMVAGVLDRAPAADALRVLRDRRVAAVCVPMSHMQARTPPLTAKRLTQAIDAPEPLYMVEPWRGEGRGLRMRDVVLMVRGRIARFTRTTTFDSTFDHDDGRAGAHSAFDLGAVTELRGGRDDALDLYALSGPPVRITGRFDFGSVLGRERGYSDGENMDRLALRLAEQAPGAEIDLDYSSFKAAPGLSRALRSTLSVTGTSTTVKRDDTPMFDFYSAWKAVIHVRLREWRAGQSSSSPKT